MCFSPDSNSPTVVIASGLSKDKLFRLDGRGVGVGGNAAKESGVFSDFTGDFFDSQEERAIDRTKAAKDQPVNRRNDFVF